MQLEKAINKVKEGEITLMISPASNVLNNDAKAIKILSGKAESGIYVTINQPYVSLKRLLDRKKIKTDSIFFIDLISSTVSAKPERLEDALFINSPTSLTELGIAIVQLLSSLPDGKKFIFIDNLTAFLIYNSLDVISEFAHFLITKMRLNNVLGMIMTVDEEEGSKLINTIGSFCDNIVKIGDTK